MRNRIDQKGTRAGLGGRRSRRFLAATRSARSVPRSVVCVSTRAATAAGTRLDGCKIESKGQVKPWS
jgi:hypothetical protein